MVVGAVSRLVIDLAFVIESKEEKQLPEKVLGTARLAKLDLKKARRIPALDNQ